MKHGDPASVGAQSVAGCGPYTRGMRGTRGPAPATDELSDESLLAGLGLADPSASTAFVSRFQGRVYGLARTILDDPALAEDVAQEAMSRAWRHAQAFDPRKGSVATWLLSITRNLSIDALRLRRAVPIDPEAVLAFDHPSTDKGPADKAGLSDDVARLKTAIASLPVEQMRAVVLAGLYGRTAQEISLAEGIPLGTAKTRIRTAMGKLRLALVEGETARWGQ